MGVEFEVPLTDSVDSLAALLPQSGLQLWDNYYYYSGSQTLPSNQTAEDCTEPVLWIVYEKTIPISEAQMTPFRRLLSAANDGADPPCVHNFRPVHQLYNANDTGNYFCKGNFLCTLAQIFEGILDGGFSTGRQLGQVGTSAGRKKLNLRYLWFDFCLVLSSKVSLQVNCPHRELCSSGSSQTYLNRSSLFYP